MATKATKIPFEVELAHEMNCFTNRIVELAIKHERGASDVYTHVKGAINGTFDEMTKLVDKQQHDIQEMMYDTGATLNAVIEQNKAAEAALLEMAELMGGIFGGK
jgi:hypothetical protein